MSLTTRFGVLVIALTISGCMQPSGPVLGAWHGRPPGREPGSRRIVDLVLDGAPDAQSGSYRITSTDIDPSVISGHGEDHWGGTWIRGTRVVGGSTITTITLKDHLPDDVGAYMLGTDGALHILDPNGLPDTSRAGALYTLSPVEPRHAQ